jgi:uncharacterized membrane protein
VTRKQNKQHNSVRQDASAVPAKRSLDSILPPGLPPGSVAQVVSRTVSQSYSGPVPPPDILRQYDQIVPGAAARILAQAEAQTQHRIELEKKVTTSDISRSYWGLGIGATLGFVGLVGGCLVAILGHDTAGATIAGTSLTALAAVFVYGTTVRRSERKERVELMTGKKQLAPKEPVHN